MIGASRLDRVEAKQAARVIFRSRRAIEEPSRPAASRPWSAADRSGVAGIPGRPSGVHGAHALREQPAHRIACIRRVPARDTATSPGLPATPTESVVRSAGMRPVIELVDIARFYQMGDERIAALDGVSFAVNTGEMVAIVGSSGSGKSTLLNVLGCLDTPSSGVYRLDGIDVQDLSDDDRARARNRKIGFVFQSFQLLHRASAQKNVALPLTYSGIPARERNARAAKALERVGLGARMTHKPYQLSGGQRQRTAIARALVTEPSLLLCDEPTGNLDSTTSEDIMGLFHALHAEGNTILIVTHEPKIAARCPRAIRIADGKIVADGPGVELLKGAA